MTRTSAFDASTVDVAGLETALCEAVDAEVRFDAGSRGAYASDGSNHRQVPIGVVVPRSVEAGAPAVGVCARFGAALDLSRRGGTSRQQRGVDRGTAPRTPTRTPPPRCPTCGTRSGSTTTSGPRASSSTASSTPAAAASPPAPTAPDWA